MFEIAAIVGAVLLGLLLIFLVYRAARTYDAGAHATFITTKNGNFYGALRAPMTIWNPSIKVLREKHAPDLKIMTSDPTGAYFEKSMVNRRNGEISLRVQTCAPRPFMATTTDKRMLLIKPKVAFQLDIDRIQIPTQMESFGTTLCSRIENLFDFTLGEKGTLNEAGGLSVQALFLNDTNVEAVIHAVTKYQTSNIVNAPSLTSN